MNGELTFVLTDVESSTTLWELFPDQMSTAIAAHEAIIAAAVTRHGGDLIRDRGEGDSTFAVFTSPVAAVAAASELARELFNTAWSEEAPLRVRVVVYTGEVESRDGDYYGTTVNRAARTRSLAFGGQVLLGSRTVELVGDELPPLTELVDLGPRELKDLASPEHVHELRLVDAGAPPEPLSDADASNDLWMERLLSSGFVDRDRERRTLVQGWATAAAGDRELALVEGEPGIGKTSIAAAVAHHVIVDGGLVLYGRWDEDFLAPFQAFREALGSYARRCPRSILRADLRDQGDEIARLFPEIARSIDVAPSAGSTPLESERLRLFEAIDAWLAAIASRRPICLVLDDLHWADRQSFLFLLHLVRSPRRAPLFVVATFRSDAITEGDGARYIPELARHTNVRRISLSGLARGDIEDLVEHMSGDRSASTTALAEELRMETGGNPLFLREIVQHLADLDSLDIAARRNVLLPDSVRELVRWRLRPLRDETRETLSIASVIGQEFDAEVLASARGGQAVDVSSSLEESRRAGVLHDVGDVGRRYAFNHAIVRRALLDDLSGARKAGFHWRIGEALEQQQPPVSAGQLAHHFCAAVTPSRAEKAIEYARAAAVEAMHELAFEAAIRHFRRALEIQSSMCPDDGVLRCELLVGLGEAYDRAGEYLDRSSCFREAADEARRLGRPDLFARAALGFRGVLPAAADPDPEAQSFLEESLQLLPEGDSPLRALVLGRLAHSLQLVPPRTRRVTLANEAVEMARRLGDPADLAAVLIYRCWALDGPDDLDEQIRTAGEIRALGEQIGDKIIVLRSLHMLSDALFESGDIDALLAAIDEMRQLANELRFPEYIRIVLAWEAVFAGIEGRYDDAQRIADDVHEMLKAMAHPQAERVYQGLLMPMNWLRGDLIQGLELYEQLAAQMPDAFIFHMIVAWATVEVGNNDRARPALDAISRDEIASLDHNSTWWPAMAGLVDVATMLEDREWCELLYDLLSPFAGRLASAGSTSFVGAASYHLAVLTAVLGRFDEAERHFEAALEQHRQLGARPFLALTQVSFARALDGRNGPGDAERSSELRTQALTVAVELGLQSVLLRASLDPVGTSGGTTGGGTTDAR
jgi:class 3 adenylate cyclase/tetratricopeptide (TPR) repeat protein